MKPIRMNPKYDQTIWAGTRLDQIRRRPMNHEGTSWEMSGHPSYDSVIENGSLKGKTLRSAIEENKEEILGTALPRMLRIAMLDAGQSLSIQVHPDDSYALSHENDEGKTESWYILDADPGAALVAGSDFTSKDEIRKAIETDTIEEHLHHIPVQRGDFIAIPSGTLHALGAGILAVEIGTNSNTTYRFYDFHRKDQYGHERQLHIDKSIDVVKLGTRSEKISTPEDGGAKEKVLCDLPEFSVTLVDIDGAYELIPDGTAFLTLTNVGKDASYTCEGETEALEYTRTLLIPASCSRITIQGSTRILIGKPKGHFHENH